MKEPNVTEDSAVKPKPKKTGEENAAGNKKNAAPGKDSDVTGKTSGSGEAVKDEKTVAEASDETNEPDEKTVDPEEVFREELASEKDKYLRLAAEYDNYRKRSVKEREKTYNDARADTITRLLPVYDNLERALKMECADEAFYKGVEMTMTQLTEILESMDVLQIPTVGEPFDPNLHNAVMAIEDPELGEKIIAEEYQRGFILGDKVIRHSTVVVAN